MNSVIAALKSFDQDYAAGTPKLTDQQYDCLREAAKALWPRDAYWKKIGAKVAGRVEAKLPVRMTSLEKKRPGEVMKWVLEKCPKDAEFLLTPKLDGAAILLHYKNGVLQKGYTRGEDGLYGQIIPYIRHIQGALPVISRQSDFAPTTGDVYIKAECICHQSIFEQKYSKLTGKGDYKNARNFLVGLINRLNHTSATVKMLNDLTIVCYGMHREIDGKKIYCANKVGELLTAAYWGFTTVLMPTRWEESLWQKFSRGQIALLDSKDYPPQVFKPLANYWHPNRSTLSVDFLNHIIKTWRASKDLDVLQDGVVLEVCQHGYRKTMGFADARPGFSYAVKPNQENQESKVGTVDHIEWNMSSRRIFKPVIVLKEKLVFDGVEVNRVTAYNAGFVRSMGLSPGSKVKVIRSGFVIPVITEVIAWPNIQKRVTKKNLVK